MVRLAGPKAVNLNEEAVAQEKQRVTREAQEAAVNKQYGHTLRLISSGDSAAARQQLWELLRHPLLLEAAQHSAPAFKPKKPAALSFVDRILYLTLRNLADLEAADAAASDAPDGAARQRLCLALYCDALGVDGSDAGAWLRFGRQAVQCGDLDVGRLALESGLAIDPSHPLLLDALLTLLCQMGDAQGSLIVAKRLRRRDPCHPLAQRLAQADAGAEHVRRLTQLLPTASPVGGPAAAAEWDAQIAALRHSALLRTLSCLPGGPPPPDRGDEAAEADPTLEGWASGGRIVLKLETFDWLALLQQIALCLEWIARRGARRMRAAKTQATQSKGARLRLAPVATCLHVVPDYAASVAQAGGGGGGGGGGAPAGDAAAADASEGADVPRKMRARAASGVNQPTAGAAPADAPKADAAALSTFAVPPALLSKPVQLRFVGQAAADAASLCCDGFEADGAAAMDVDSVFDVAPTPDATASRRIGEEATAACDGAKAPPKPPGGATIVHGAAARASEPDPGQSESAEAGARQESADAAEAVDGEGAEQKSAAQKDGAAVAVASAPVPSKKPEVGSRVSKRREHQMQREQQERDRQAREEQVSTRNVLHLLAPPLLADAGFGPDAVQLGPADRGSLAANVPPPLPSRPPPDGAVPPSPALKRLAGAPALERFLEALAAQRRGPGGLTLKVGLFELADLVLQAACGDAAAALPADAVAAVMRIDAARSPHLPPACHLFLAELCIDQAAQLQASGSSTARDKLRELETRKARERGASRAADNAAAGDHEPEKTLKKELDGLTVRAGAHLAAFRSAMCDARRPRPPRLPNVLATVSCDDADAGPPDSDACARACWARFHWALHSLAWQRGDLADARAQLRHCHDVCGASTSGPAPAADGATALASTATAACVVELDGAPAISVVLASCVPPVRISAWDADCARQRLGLHDMLDRLKALTDAGRHREALEGMLPHLLDDYGRAASLFPSSRSFLRALQILLALLQHLSPDALPGDCDAILALSPIDAAPARDGGVKGAAAAGPAAPAAPAGVDEAAGGAGSASVEQNADAQGARSRRPALSIDVSGAGAAAGELPGRLSRGEAIWLRAECCLQMLRAGLPHDPIVAGTDLLPPDRRRWVPSVLGVGAERTGVVLGWNVQRPPVVDAVPRAPSAKLLRVLSILTSLSDALETAVSAAAQRAASTADHPATGSALAASALAAHDDQEPGAASVAARFASKLLDSITHARPLDLTDIKLPLLAYVESVYWAQFTLERQAFECAAALGADTAGGGAAPSAAAAAGGMTRDAELLRTLRDAHHMASCVLLLLHVLDAAPLRKHLCSALGLGVDADGLAASPGAPASEATGPTSRDRGLPRLAEVTSAMHASIRAELCTLEGLFRLLNDRQLLQHADFAFVKTALRRLSQLLPLLARTRQASAEVFDAVAASDDEEEDDGPEADGAEEASAEPAATGGFGVKMTVQDLIREGVLVPGKGVLVVHYKQERYPGDLLPDGTIEADGHSFASLSQFAVEMMRKLTPSRKSVNGWERVFFEGKSLAHWRVQLSAKRDNNNNHTLGPDSSDDASGDDAADGDDATGPRGYRRLQRTLRDVVQAHATLEADVNGAFAKVLFVLHGVRLEWIDAAWGGEVPGGPERSTAAEMADDVAVEVWGYARPHLEALLQPDGVRLRKLQSFRALIDRMYAAFPHPPAEVHAFLSTYIIDPLLSPSSALTQQDLAESPALLAYLPPVQCRRCQLTAADFEGRPPPSPPAPPDPDPRLLGPTDVFAVLYHAKCVLVRERGDRRASLLPGALLGPHAAQLLASDAQMMLYDLAYNPRRCAGWAMLAEFYELAATTLIDEATATLSRAAWRSAERAQTRQLYVSLLDRALRGWTVANRVAPTPSRAAWALHRRLLLHWRRLQRCPPHGTALEPRRPDDEFSGVPRQLAAAEGCARAMVALGEATPHAFDDVPLWQAYYFLGKVLTKQAGHPTADAIAAFARGAGLAKRRPAGAVDALAKLHAARAKVLARAALAVPGGAALLARVCEPPLAQLPDEGVLPAVLSALDGWSASASSVASKLGSALLEDETWKAARSHCFLPPVAEAMRAGGQLSAGGLSAVADTLDGGGAAVDAIPTPKHAGSGTAARADDERRALRSAALLFYDAIAALRWCVAADGRHHRARHALAAAYEAAGAITAARAEARRLFVVAGKFGAILRDAHPPVAAAPAAAEVAVAAADERTFGLRPAAPAAACLEDGARKRGASVGRYLLRYARLCRTEGNLEAAWEAVEWGVKSKWGAGGVDDVSDVGELMLGTFAVDLASAVTNLVDDPTPAPSSAPDASADGAGADAARERLLQQLLSSFRRRRAAGSRDAVRRFEALLGLAWQLQRTVTLEGGSEGLRQGWRVLRAAVAAAVAEQAGAHRLGVVAPFEPAAVSEHALVAFLQAYMIVLEELGRPDALEGVLTHLKRRSVASCAEREPLVRALVEFSAQRAFKLMYSTADLVLRQHAAVRSACRPSLPGAAATDAAAEGAAPAAPPARGSIEDVAAALAARLAGDDAECGVVPLLSRALLLLSCRPLAACAARVAARAHELVCACHRHLRQPAPAEPSADPGRGREAILQLLARLLAVVVWHQGIQGSTLRPQQGGVFEAAPAAALEQCAAELEARSRSGAGLSGPVPLPYGLLALVTAQQAAATPPGGVAPADTATSGPDNPPEASAYKPRGRLVLPAAASQAAADSAAPRQKRALSGGELGASDLLSRSQAFGSLGAGFSPLFGAGAGPPQQAAPHAQALGSHAGLDAHALLSACMVPGFEGYGFAAGGPSIGALAPQPTLPLAQPVMGGAAMGGLEGLVASTPSAPVGVRGKRSLASNGPEGSQLTNKKPRTGVDEGSA